MDYIDGGSATLERVSDIEKNPAGVVKRWLLEIKLADKREADWRKKADRVYNRYRQKNAKANSFNILWANTETLRPAVYNSLPKPDVRRRFKDADPMGKAVSDVISRSLEYGLDTTSFDEDIKACVLDMLLPGRGVARVRYVPSLQQVGVTPEDHDEELEQHEPAGEALEGDGEEVTWEQAPIEHVQYDDFRILCAAKEWCEVSAMGFRHRLTRTELESQFGEKGAACQLDATEDDDVKNERDDSLRDSFKTAEVWEIWDKDNHRVLFISQGLKEEPLQVVDDPLTLQGFFPIPKPLYSVEDSGSLVPIPLYELYREQAEELDRVSSRINKIINGLKLRGVYDATITELSELMRGEDNDFIPAQNVTALLERGGLDKAIWTTGNLIQSAAIVLKELYLQRDQIKAVIYEITGISDILRGATNANETATAQQIKSQWGSSRLKRMQGDVQRFIRDLIRLQGEIIAERFSQETIQTMTGLKFPTLPEKQQAMMQYQMAQQQAQQQGQQAQIPPPPNVPCWEEIIQVMRDDKQRTFKIDIETDSTVAGSLEADMQGLQQISQAMGVVMKEFMPMVQMGALPLDAMKEVLLAISRRAKFGNALEDALDKMQQPQPQAQEQDNSPQVEQVRQQGEMQRFQAEQQVKQAELQATQQLESAKLQQQAQMEQFKAQIQAEGEAQRLEFDKFKAQLEAETKVLVAQIAAEAGAKQAQINAETTLATASMQGSEEPKEEKAESSTGDALAAAIQGFQVAIEQLRAPRQVIRGADGRVSGIQ